ncbi:MAG: SAM-dependent methyltransferase [Candidatus Nitricoxidivorans perseverans]|uniref:SAM-dependent methyltransferase n=1 Tax=Candidatus Nitricoxidivorans perseverans TaxID=2975601 RepID=A0AA49FIB1_9PROT|nr:MAG: SAM-dependent methyltransferase [Candidatus Nitricoxidivorans perseverans]
MDQRPPLAAVAALSAAALGYEVLLLRLFAIIQWHHFAYLAISVALLGIGAAGTFVTLARRRLLAGYPHSFSLAAAAFAVAAVACFAVAERVPFNALEIAWNSGQFLGLAAIYLLLFIPFFCAATALCIAYSGFGAHIPRLYGADIFGAGLGSLGLLGALFFLHPADALRAICALGLAAAALAAWPAAKRWAAAFACAALAALWLLPAQALELVASDYKDLRQALRVKDARVVAQRISPLGVVTAVTSPLAPLHHAPGLSLNAAAGPPPQLALFVDGQAAGAVTRFDGSMAPLAYLADTTSALPYRLLDRPRVLVLGAGAGGDVLQALVHGARRVDAVELDAQVAAMVQKDLADFSGRPYSASGVRLHIAEARGFVAADTAQYDLIQVALLDAFGASAAGLGSLLESHLYTVEALDGYLRRLAPGGLLAFTRWVSLPPRDSLRLFVTAAAALERRGATAPGRSLAMIRGWNTTTLLVKNDAFAPAEIAAIRDFSRQRAFDTVHVPGIVAAQANVFNALARDDFFAGAQALLGPGRAEFIDRYKFDLTPTTDDRPYFFHFFKWRTLPELLDLRSRGGLPPLDWGYPVLVMALLQAVTVSLLLILLPLALGQTRQAFAAAAPALRRRVATYFLALGLGFMAIEIPFLQRFTLFLSHPLYAAAVVLAAFLIFAGAGARFSARLRPSARWPFAAIASIALFYVVALPPLLAALMGIALGWKMLLTLLLVAPLAFCLGLPFPLGLAVLAARAEALVPWAWGINGFASVVAALLSTLLAIHWGHSVVVLLAASLYVLAAWQFPHADEPGGCA